MKDVSGLHQQITDLKSEIMKRDKIIKELKEELKTEKMKNIENLEVRFDMVVRHFGKIAMSSMNYNLKSLEDRAIKISGLSDVQKSTISLIENRYTGQIHNKTHKFIESRWEPFLSKENKGTEEFWNFVDDFRELISLFKEDADQLWRILTTLEEIPSNVKDNYNRLARMYNDMASEFQGFFTKFAPQYNKNIMGIDIMSSLP